MMVNLLGKNEDIPRKERRTKIDDVDDTTLSACSLDEVVDHVIATHKINPHWAGSTSPVITPWFVVP